MILKFRIDIPQIFENKTSKMAGLKALSLHLRQRQEGLAIFWIIAIIVAFAALGSAIVANYNVSLFSQIDTSLVLTAESLAESGYRFFYSEYNSQTSDVDRNKLLEELHGKTFNIAPDGKGGQFQLDMTSYFYRTETGTSGSQLKARFIGNPPDGYTVPTTGYIRNIKDNELYEYNSRSEAGGVYTFNCDRTVSTTDQYVTVLPAANINNFENVDGSYVLTLGSVEEGGLFPPEKGMFLITKKKIKNLPVTQIIPYYYEYRSGGQLFKITKGPGVGDSDATDPEAGDMAEVAKFVALESVGYAPDKANFAAKEINESQISLDIAASSSWHSSTDTELYLSADESAASTYGDSEQTLTGGVTHTATGKVSGAFEFDGTGYITTTFNPRTEIGSQQSFTVVFWAKPNTLSGFQAVVGSGDWSLPSIERFYIGLYDNEWIWGYGDLYGDYTSGELPDATANQWQHIAYVYDKDLDDIIIYVNGLEKYRFEDYTLNGGSGLISDVSIDIGGIHRQGDTHDTNFDGAIDEIAIFSKALSLCEIREIYDVPCNIGCGTFNTANDPGVDPVAYYPFNCDADDDNQASCSAGMAVDESGTDKDGEPYNNDGTVFNAVLAVDRFGCDDKAYTFNGSNAYIQVPHSASLEMSDVDKVTVAAWVKAEADHTGDQWIALLQKSDASYNLQLNYGKPTFTIHDTSTHYSATTASTVTVGVWYHLVGTFDGFNVKIYVDGQLKATTPVTIPNTIADASDQDVGIGYNIEQPSRYFQGQIDDISVWDRDLTLSEIQDYYDQTSHK